MDVNTAGLRHQAPESPRRQMGCWGGFACLKPRKGGRRVVPAARLADGTASSSQWAGTRQPASGAQNQFPNLSPSLLAPPSSPASFQNSAVHSSAQSPSLHVARQVETTTAMMFQTGPYAHETALVTPPVFSTFTTAPSTAPFTPPPELAHITTPSSPEVPFAQLLTSSLNVKGPVRQQSDTTTASSTAPFTPPPELAQATNPCSPEVPFAQLLTSSFAANTTSRQQPEATTPSSTGPITPPPEPAQGAVASSPDVPFAQFLTSTFSVKGAGREPDVTYSASPFASPEYCIGDSQAAFERRSGSLYAQSRTSTSVGGVSSSLPEHLPSGLSSSSLPLTTFPILQPETWVELEVRSTGMSNRSSQELGGTMPSEPETSLFTICHGDDLLRPDYAPQFFDELDDLPSPAVSRKSNSGKLEDLHLGRLTKVSEEDDPKTEEDYLVLEGFHLDSNYHGSLLESMSMEKRGDQRFADFISASHLEGGIPAAQKLDHCEGPAVAGRNGSDGVACEEAPGSVVKIKTQVSSPQGLHMPSAVAMESGYSSVRDQTRAQDVLMRSLLVTPSKKREESPAMKCDDHTSHPLKNPEAVSPRYGVLLSKCEELSLALQMAEAREREALELLDETQKKATSLEESVARLSVELSHQELAFLDLQSKHFAHLGVASPNHILSSGFNLVA